MRLHGEIAGDSSAIVELRREIERLARSDTRVLITGERGVGKELVAREIHARSARGGRPFVPVTCAGIPETLLESELFGHVKGSFTGAYRDKPGRLELAHEGTVFVDEVGEMSIRMQGLLLKFLETGEIRKVGTARTAERADVRLLAATNRPLNEMIARAAFRQDLFDRLNAAHVTVPPLRERRQDIPTLIGRLLRQFAEANQSRVEAISPDALRALMNYAWPGNVRELENVIERLVVIGGGPVLQLADLPADLRASRRASASPAVPAPASSDIVDDLYGRLTQQRESFWTAVYPLYMQREITRTQVRDVVRKGLEEARGNYKIMVELFNMDSGDYKKFLNFLRKHQCQLPFKDYRQVAHNGSIGQA